MTLEEFNIYMNTKFDELIDKLCSEWVIKIFSNNLKHTKTSLMIICSNNIKKRSFTKKPLKNTSENASIFCT